MRFKRIVSFILSICFVVAATFIGAPNGDFFAYGDATVNETIVIEDGKLVSGSSELIDSGYIAVDSGDSNEDFTPAIYPSVIPDAVEQNVSALETDRNSTTNHISNYITEGSYKQYFQSSTGVFFLNGPAQWPNVAISSWPDESTTISSTTNEFQCDQIVFENGEYFVSIYSWISLRKGQKIVVKEGAKVTLCNFWLDSSGYKRVYTNSSSLTDYTNCGLVRHMLEGDMILVDGGTLNIVGHHSGNGRFVINGGRVGYEFGSFGIPVQDDPGGALIRVKNGGTLNLENVNFCQNYNSADNGGGIVLESGTVNIEGAVNFNTLWTSGDGGALYAEGADCEINLGTAINDEDYYFDIRFNSTTTPVFNNDGAFGYIYSNKAGVSRLGVADADGGNGGGFALVNGAKMNITEMVVGTTGLNIGDNNGRVTSATKGGQFYLSGNSSLTLNSGMVKHAVADCGAGVYIDDNASFVMNGGTFGGVDDPLYIAKGHPVNNSTDTYNTSTTITSKSYTCVTGNYAKYNGGGVYVSANATFTMSGGLIRNCYSSYNAVDNVIAVYSSGSTTEINRANDVAYLTLALNGNGGNGGAVCVDGGTFTMTGGTIGENGLSNIASYGGGVAVINGGSFTVSGNSVITYNGKKDVTTDGGGIYSHGVGTTVTINNCTVSYNTASHGAGVYGNYYVDITMNNGNIVNNQHGGGVFVYCGTQFLMNNGSINNNVLAADNTNMGDLGGAGVCILPNSAQTRETKFTIKNGTISGNVNNRYNGGGVSVASRTGHTGGIFVMEGGQINNNSTTAGHGGGISALSGVVLISGSSTINGNSASNDAGGIYCEKSRVVIGVKGGANTVQICNNTATTGAALYTVQCITSADDVDESTTNGIIFYNGTVKGNTDNGYAAVLLRAGGLFLMYDGVIADNITNGTAPASGKGTNRAVYVSGVDSTYTKNLAVINGGALEGNEDSSTSLRSTNGGVIFLNYGRIEINGGSISNGYAPLGGGIYISESADVNALTMTGGVITSCFANRSDGATGAGGGVYISFGKNFVMSGGSIANNESIEGGGVYIGRATFQMSGDATIQGNIATKYYGGGLALVGGTFTANGGHFIDNYAKTYGGALFISHGLIDAAVSPNGADGVASIVGTEFTNNIAWVSGGGIFAHSYTDDNNRAGNVSVSIGNSSFTGNDVDPNSTSNEGKKGGAIYAGSNVLTKLSIAGSAFNSNTSYLAGGAIFLTKTDSAYRYTIEDCVFDYNVTTHGNGGAIGLDNVAGGVDISNSELFCNEALCTTQDGNAGALVINETPCNISNCIFGGDSAEYANKSYKLGGAIHLKGANSVVTFTACKVSYNEAGGSGGGIACDSDADMFFYGGEVTYNTSGSNGGGIYISGAPNCKIYSISFTNLLSDAASHDVVEIIGNYAANNGGGIYLSSAGCVIGGAANLPVDVSDIVSVKIYSNKAEGEGGGLFLHHEELGLDYTVDVGGDSYETGNVAIGNGGGIAIRNTAKLTIDGTLVRHNTAGNGVKDEKGNGGGIFVTCNALAQVFNHDGNQCTAASTDKDKHVACTSGSELIINSGIISLNISNGKDIVPLVETVDGKEYVTYGITPGGGGISVMCSSSATIGTVGTPKPENNEFAVVISRNESNFSGGGIDSMFYSTVTLGANLLITENKACLYKDGCTNVDRWRGGGGVCVSDASTLTIDGTYILNNIAEASDFTYVDYKGVTRTASALSSGGGVCVGHDKLTNNTPASVKKSSALIKNAYINGNDGGLGGGVHVRYAASTIIKDTVLDSNNGFNGGGIYVDNYDTVVKVADLTVTNNTAVYGGGIYVGNGLAGQSSTLYIYDDVTDTGVKATDSDNGRGTLIQSNIAANNGGGIFLHQAGGSVGNIIIEDTDIKDNLARMNGGGIATLGTVTMSGGYIINNKVECPDPTEGNTGNNKVYGDLRGVGGGVALFNESSFTFYVTNKNGAIYGNTASFAGDDVFATGNQTKLSLPKAAAMDTSAYSTDPTLSWQEDYANADTAYTSGLAGGSYTDGSDAIKRYRQSLYSVAAYVDSTEPQNVSQHKGGYINNTTDTVYVAITLGINNSRGTITITKAGIDAECDQVFMFRVIGTTVHGNPVELTISLHSGNNFTSTITMVPQGTYTITELTEWSWRYVCESITFVDGTVTVGKYSVGDVDCSVILDYQQMAPSVVFNNTMQEEQWLDGNGVPVKNVYGETPVDEVEQVTTLFAVTLPKKESYC